MIPQKLAPDLIRGGNRSSDQIMHGQKFAIAGRYDSIGT